MDAKSSEQGEGNADRKPGFAELQEHASKVYPALALLAGMQLDVFTCLKDGPRDVQEIAGILGVQPARLGRHLYALAGAGFLIWKRNGSATRL